MKYDTNQRKEVLAFFSNNKSSCFSAQEIGEALPSVAQSTLYRLLSSLVDEGALKKCPTSKRQALYQYSGKECPGHMHIRCTRCGRIEHISEKDSEKIESLLQSKLDFNVLASSTLDGICSECREKNK